MMKQNELLEVAKAMRDYIDALPTDVVAALPVMPGFDRAGPTKSFTKPNPPANNPRLRPFHLNSGRHNLSDFIEKTASFCPLFSFVSRLSRSIIKTDQHNH